MREVDGPSFLFIDFNVALAPRLSGIKTALQLSENITLFAICGIHINVIGKEGQINTWCLGGIIYVYTLYNVGDRMEPCGTPACIFLRVDISSSSETL
jgi:hypothetical protein